VDADVFEVFKGDWADMSNERERIYNDERHQHIQWLFSTICLQFIEKTPGEFRARALFLIK
jgi:hypothetical protein